MVSLAENNARGRRSKAGGRGGKEREGGGPTKVGGEEGYHLGREDAKLLVIARCEPLWEAPCLQHPLCNFLREGRHHRGGGLPKRLLYLHTVGGTAKPCSAPWQSQNEGSGCCRVGCNRSIDAL